MNLVRACGWGVIVAAWALPIGAITWLNFALKDATCAKAAQASMRQMEELSTAVEEYKVLNGHYPVGHDIQSLLALVGLAPSRVRLAVGGSMGYDSDGSEYVLSARWPGSGELGRRGQGFEIRDGHWARWPACVPAGDVARMR
jgi:hypothetical protein